MRRTKKSASREMTVGDWLTKTPRRYMLLPPHDVQLREGGGVVFGQFDIERLLRATPMSVLELYRVNDRRPPEPGK